MTPPKKLTDFNPESTTAQTVEMDLSAILGDNTVELKDVTKRWQLIDIKRYLISQKTKEKALIAAERMTGLWIQAAAFDRVPTEMRDDNGTTLWVFMDENGNCTMLDYLRKFINLFFLAVEMTNNARMKMEELTENEQASAAKAKSKYEMAVKRLVERIQNVFQKHKLREKLPVLKRLSDVSYDVLCLKMLTGGPAKLMAFAYCIGLPEYVGKNEDPFLSSHAEMYKLLADAVPPSNAGTLKQEFLSITSESEDGRSRHTAWKYVDEAREFIESLQ